MSVVSEDAYREKYVVFLDLLGFRARVDAANKNSEARREILETLGILKSTLYNDGPSGARFTHFSDCIIFTTDRTPQGLMEILHAIEVLTRNILNCDFFVRGGLAAGGVHHDQDFVYGSAVNRAYEIASRKHNLPVTMVSNEILHDAKGYGSQFEEFLTRDAKGRHFVHYLRVYSEYTREPLWPGKVSNSLVPLPHHASQLVLWYRAA